MRHLRDVLVSWGPLGVFTLAVIESAGIPNPGGTDALLLLVAIARPQDAMLSAILAACGSLLGSAIFYEIMRKGGQTVLKKYTSSQRGQKFGAWYMRYGLITVFIPALLPIPILPFKVFAACAGALGVPRVRFLGVIAAARFPRYLALAYLGAKLGENSAAWLRSHLWHLLGVAIVIGILLWGLMRMADKRGTANAL
jgi:membrane protein YqaA with SNARE-associated domain